MGDTECKVLTMTTFSRGIYIIMHLIVSPETSILGANLLKGDPPQKKIKKHEKQTFTDVSCVSDPDARPSAFNLVKLASLPRLELRAVRAVAPPPRTRRPPLALLFGPHSPSACSPWRPSARACGGMRGCTWRLAAAASRE